MMKRIVPVIVAIAISASALAAGKTVKQVSGVVNINTATASELTMLPGVGKAKADAIIAYRQATPFKSPNEITKIKGIGDKMFAKMQANVAVDGPTTAKVVKVPVTGTQEVASASQPTPKAVQPSK